MEPLKNILSIDDSLSNQRLIARVLADDYTVTPAMSGSEGIALLDDINPELILLDVDMPGIDGFETCRQIRKNQQHHQTPILFLSCLTDPADQITGLHAGADDYISKPADIDVLKTKIALRIRRSLKNHTELLEKYVVEPANDEKQTKLNDNDAILIEFLKSLLKATHINNIILAMSTAFGKLSLEYALRIHADQIYTKRNINISALEDILLDQAEGDVPESHSARLVVACTNIVLIIRNAEYISQQRMGHLSRQKCMPALRDFLNEILKAAQVRINQI